MRADLAAVLRCPRCGGDLNELESNALMCDGGHTYPIVDGVPRFVQSEDYSRNFGFEWTLHQRTQLDDEASHESEVVFTEKTGFHPDQLRGRLVLDVGCGMGRFADVASRWGATVIGVDLSHAVDAAHANLADRPNVMIVQASVFELPFKDGAFDVVYSIGVLHHTPNTRRAFDRLPRLLKPGGKLAVWLYSAYNEREYRGSDRWRRLTTRLSDRTLYRLCHLAIPAYHLYGLRYIGPFMRSQLPISMDPRPEWRVLDTFDWYSPKYQWKHTYEEVFPWFDAHGLEDIKVLGVPIAVQGTRPVLRRSSARDR